MRNATRIGRPRKKWTMFASTLTSGRISAGNSTFLIRFPPAISAPAASDNDDENHERIDGQQQQRVDERPEKAKRRAAIARLQLPRDETLDQPAISNEVG